MQITKNFSLEELISSTTARKKGIKNFPGISEINSLERLCLTILQPVRDKFGEPIIVTSGFRGPQLNKAVGGSPTSQHIKGEAADITSKDNKTLWKLINSMIENKEIQVGQLIDEHRLKWIHISLPSPKHINKILLDN